MRKKAMKLLSVMLAIFMAFAAVPLSGLAGIDLPIFRASAVEETETEISGKLGTKLAWSIDKASKTLTIDNKGQMISFSTTEAPWKNYKSYFDAVVINDGCANVGAGAFSGCENIVSVDLPSSISTIDDSAFYGCGLKTIEIPYGVKTINSSSFSFCRNLETVKLAYGVTTIGSYAFEYCINLININIPDSVEVLGSAAFRNCIRLENIKISDSVGHLGSYTFADCVSLSNVLLGSRIKTIGNNAFAGCKNLSVISMPYFCGKISMSAFAGCSNLSQVYIYNKGCSIDQDAIPITATIYGFTGSTAEDFATQYGYNFVSIDTPCEHEYSNDCDNSCNKCGEIRDAAHSFGGWTVEREATCSQTGLQIRTCSVCGTVEREALPLIDHTDANDDGICDICKKQFALRYPKNGVCGPKLTWTLDDDGVLTIEGTGEMYDFYEGDSIFVFDGTQSPNTTTTAPGISTVTKSDDPDIRPTENTTNTDVSVTHPGRPSFDWEETTTVYKEDVTRPYASSYKMSQKAPSKMAYGADIAYSEPITNTTMANIAPDGSIKIFRWNLHFDEIKKVIIKEGVTGISDRAFKSCKQLSEVKIADSVRNIGQEAFYGCSSLKEISIPKNVESIGYRAFGSCELLSTFDYDAANCSHEVYWFDDNTVIKTLYIGSDVKEIPKIRSIQTVIFKEGITEIPREAFSGFAELTAVMLPETLTRIGNEAFNNCKSIREITIPTEVIYIGWRAFGYCTSLEVVNFNSVNCGELSYSCFEDSPVKKINVGIGVNILPRLLTVENVTFANGAVKVPDNAFSHCAKLTTVTLPDSIETIGSHAFEYCEKLQNIELPQKLKIVGPAAFFACYNLRGAELPSSVIRIEEGAFDNCTSLPNISIPNSVEHIGRYAFYGCVTAPEVVIPSNVKYIGFAAFGSCTALKEATFNATNCDNNGNDIFYNSINLSSIKIGSNVTVIPDEFVRGKTNITEVTISDSVKTIGYAAFSGTALTEIAVPESVETIGEQAFANISTLRKINFNAVDAQCKDNVFRYSGADGIDVVFGDSVERVPNRIFYNHNDGPIDPLKINTVHFGSNTKEIGEHAFFDCSSLKELDLPKSVEKISNKAFSGCNSLKELDLSLIKEIGDFAFAGCSGLQELDLASVNEIGCSAFARCSSLTELEIPQGVKRINSQAFMDCKSIETVNYNAEDCEISNYYIFANCTAVKTVNIGSTVKSIPAYTFSGCSNLERAYFPDIAVQIDPLAFFGCGNVAIVCPNGSYANVYAIQNGIKYILEDGVNDTAFEIRNGMLLGYSGSAQNIVLPSDLNSVGIGAFDGNSVVRSIEIPYNISKIYSNAFANCPNLEQVIIPFTVTDISSSAFNGTNAVIYCYYNSYAYKFAMANNIKCELITVTLSENSVSTFAGGATAVKAVPSVTVASGIPLVWRSADPTVADVDSKGNIVGKSEGNTTVGVYSLGGNLLAECKVSVSKRIDLKFATPSTTTVKYGEKLILHIDTSTLPEGTTVEWSVSGSNAFRLSDENAVCTLHRSCVTCAVESIAKGSATITAKVVDKNGNAVKDANGNEISASQQLTSKAGFFQKLVAFFKKLFGSNMVIPSSLNKLIK